MQDHPVIKLIQQSNYLPEYQGNLEKPCACCWNLVR